MERLTINELAPYLPYGLKVKYNNGEEINIISTMKGIEDENNILTENHVVSMNFAFKPLLRPLSSINLKWFQDNIDEAIEDFRINCEPENNHFSVEVCEKVLGWSALSLEEYQLFYEHHVDIHGLIDRSLALPIDGKEVESE